MIALGLGVDMRPDPSVGHENFAHVNPCLDVEPLGTLAAAALRGLLHGRRGVGGATWGVFYRLEPKDHTDALRTQLVYLAAEAPDLLQEHVEGTVGLEERDVVHMHDQAGPEKRDPAAFPPDGRGRTDRRGQDGGGPGIEGDGPLHRGGGQAR